MFYKRLEKGKSAAQRQPTFFLSYKLNCTKTVTVVVK